MFDLQSNLAFAAMRSFSFPPSIYHQQYLSSPYAPTNDWNYYEGGYTANEQGFRIDGLADVLSASISNNLPPLPKPPTYNIRLGSERQRYQENKKQNKQLKYKTYSTTDNNKNSIDNNRFKLQKDSIVKRKEEITRDNSRQIRRMKYKEVNREYYDDPILFTDKSQTTTTTTEKKETHRKICYEGSYRPSPASRDTPRLVSYKSRQKIQIKEKERTPYRTNENTKRISASEMDLLLS